MEKKLLIFITNLCILITTISAMKQKGKQQSFYTKKLPIAKGHLKLSKDDNTIKELLCYLRNYNPRDVIKVSFGNRIQIDAVKILSRFKNLKAVSFKNCNETENNFLNYLPSYIKEVDLSNCIRFDIGIPFSLYPENIKYLFRIKNLIKVELANTKIDNPKTLEFLPKTIIILNLANSTIKKARYLSELPPYLTELNLSKAKIKDEENGEAREKNIFYINQLKNLKKLDLSWQKNISKELLVRLPQSIVILNLANSTIENPENLRLLPPYLKELNLSKTKVDDLENNIVLLKRLKYLEGLDLSGQKNITKKALTLLPSSLIKLNLAHTRIKNLDINFISKCFRKLEKIALPETDSKEEKK